MFSAFRLIKSAGWRLSHQGYIYRDMLFPLETRKQPFRSSVEFLLALEQRHLLIVERSQRGDVFGVD